MIDAMLIWSEIVVCIPCFSAMMWFLILLIARYDSYTIFERNIKHTLLWFYGLCTFVWFSFFFYIYQPAGFVYLSSLVYVAVLLMVVTYYRYVFQLTSFDVRKSISVWHTIIALIVPGMLFACSFFVPVDVQEFLVAERGQLCRGYEAYSVLFLSKPFLLFVYGIVYTTLSIRRLLIYYAAAKQKENAPIKLKRWIVVLVAITLTILLFTLFMFLVPRSQFTSIGCFGGLIVLTCGQHIVLGYNTVRRNQLVYVTEDPSKEADTAIREQAEQPEPVKRGYKRTSEVIFSPQGKLVSVPLAKKDFEAYMQNNKPYLNPKIKITDLIEPLKANRTALSNFVNDTYGVNFNRYINKLRLKELARLQKLPSNATMRLPKLIEMAGFSNMRHYHRALEVEQKEDLTDDNTVNE